MERNGFSQKTTYLIRRVLLSIRIVSILVARNGRDVVPVDFDQETVVPSFRCFSLLLASRGGFQPLRRTPMNDLLPEPNDRNKET